MKNSTLVIVFAFLVLNVFSLNAQKEDTKKDKVVVKISTNDSTWTLNLDDLKDLKMLEKDGLYKFDIKESKGKKTIKIVSKDSKHKEGDEHFDIFICSDDDVKIKKDHKVLVYVDEDEIKEGKHKTKHKKIKKIIISSEGDTIHKEMKNYAWTFTSDKENCKEMNVEVLSTADGADEIHKIVYVSEGDDKVNEIIKIKTDGDEKAKTVTVYLEGEGDEVEKSYKIYVDGEKNFNVIKKEFKTKQDGEVKSIKIDFRLPDASELKEYPKNLKSIKQELEINRLQLMFTGAGNSIGFNCDNAKKINVQLLDENGKVLDNVQADKSKKGFKAEFEKVQELNGTYYCLFTSKKAKTVAKLVVEQ